jgi:diaminopimelate epimerase
MHGLKNDFIVINNLDNNITLSGKQITFLCERKAGIGADGLILISPSKIADALMNYYNSDGTVAEICGNGIRCTAKYIFDQKIVKKRAILIETNNRVYNTKIEELDSKEQANIISINMGSAIFEKTKIPINIRQDSIFDIKVNLQEDEIILSAVAMPNPHAVIIVQKIDYEYIQKIGSKLQKSSIFPQKANINFAKINSHGNVDLVTYERGVGMTQACGSGACATGVVLNKKGLVDKHTTIHMQGGDLNIQINNDEDIIMFGQAATVYKGNIDI